MKKKGGFVSALTDTEAKLNNTIHASQPWKPKDPMLAMAELIDALGDNPIPQEIRHLCRFGHHAQALLANEPDIIKSMFQDMLKAQTVEAFVATHITPWETNPDLTLLVDTLTEMIKLVKMPEMQKAAQTYIAQQLEKLPQAQKDTGPSIQR